MLLKEFKTKLAQESKNYGKVVHTFTHMNRNVVVNSNNDVYIDGVLSEEQFLSINETKYYIKQQLQSEKLKHEVEHQIYEEISNTSIANIIKKHHEVPKVTSQLIESYVDLASSKVFTVDPVVLEMRKLNKLSNLVEGKLDFVLNNKTVIAIDEDTFLKINNFLNMCEEKDLVLNYMRESHENFLHVVKEL
jgi:hypothetical protein